MQEFLNKTYFGNTVLLYLTAVAVFLACFIAVKIFKKMILGRLDKWAASTETTIDDFVIKAVEKSIVPLLYYGAFYLAIRTIEFPARIDKIINVASIILVTFFSLRVITSGLNFTLNIFLRRKGESETRQKELKGIMGLVKLLIWVLGFVFLLDNLGFNISAVIAGLGIGGIAIALAAQAILGDLFSYFVIFFDRPFEIGDFIVVDDKVGAIEYIGIKTTRIRALSGEQLVFSNKDLTNSRVHNFKKMQRRRVVFKLGVTYQTTAEQLRKVPPLVKSVIQEQKDVTFDRTHFSTYGDFSLIFECVYYVESSDYNKFMDTQQAINLKIYEEFEKLGIEFAYPTQTLFLNKDGG
jgi:small-conductance mechanosensitive channel